MYIYYIYLYRHLLINYHILYIYISSIYNNKDFHADLSHIVLLRQSSDALIKECNDQFLNEYLKQSDSILDSLNPYFNLAWQVRIIYYYVNRLYINY